MIIRIVGPGAVYTIIDGVPNQGISFLPRRLWCAVCWDRRAVPTQESHMMVHDPQHGSCPTRWFMSQTPEIYKKVSDSLHRQVYDRLHRKNIPLPVRDTAWVSKTVKDEADSPLASRDHRCKRGQSSSSPVSPTILNQKCTELQTVVAAVKRYISQLNLYHTMSSWRLADWSLATTKF